jgi:hypothetical protein
MYHDGWYRDFDARNNQPIILENIEVAGDIFEDYYNLMMLMPVTLNIATKEQIKGLKPRFKWFKQNYSQWDLDWPPSWQVYTEAAWYAGERASIAELLWKKSDSVYARIDSREPFWVPLDKKDVGLPEKYNYRIPGIACENWPADPERYWGSENYGWGATLPTLIIRNFIGFREGENIKKNEFYLAPALPPDQVKLGEVYSINNLKYREFRFDVSYKIMANNDLDIQLIGTTKNPASLRIKDENKRTVAFSRGKKNNFKLTFEGKNLGVYRVLID